MSTQQHPLTAYPSSQHPHNYTASQYSQSSPSTSHHHSAPVILRKQSLSPNHNMQIQGAALSNGWDDGHHWTKVPHLGPNLWHFHAHNWPHLWPCSTDEVLWVTHHSPMHWDSLWPLLASLIMSLNPSDQIHVEYDSTCTHPKLNHNVTTEPLRFQATHVTYSPSQTTFQISSKKA